MLSSNNISHRITIFFILISLIAASCVYHGVLYRNKIVTVIEEMLKNGHLTGSFWRVSGVGPDRITVTKFNYSIALSYSKRSAPDIGDNVSFIAATGARSGSWHILDLRIHGTSALKFYVSLLAIIWVVIMSLKHLRFDTDTLSLVYKWRDIDA